MNTPEEKDRETEDQVRRLLEEESGGRLSGVARREKLLVREDIDSLMFIAIISRIEREYGVVLFDQETGYRKGESLENIVLTIIEAGRKSPGDKI